MSIEWVIYLGELSKNLQTAGHTVTFLSATAIFFYWVMTSDNEGSVFNKRYFLIPILSLLIASVLPSRTAVYAITATTLAKEVALDKTAKKALLLLDKKLDELLLDKDE